MKINKKALFWWIFGISMMYILISDLFGFGRELVLVLLFTSVAYLLIGIFIVTVFDNVYIDVDDWMTFSYIRDWFRRKK